MTILRDANFDTSVLSPLQELRAYQDKFIKILSCGQFFADLQNYNEAAYCTNTLKLFMGALILQDKAQDLANSQDAKINNLRASQVIADELIKETLYQQMLQSDDQIIEESKSITENQENSTD